MYKKIINPKTGRKVNINSILGKNIIKNYFSYLKKDGFKLNHIGGTFENDGSLFLMHLTGLSGFDHTFGIIITSNIEFKGMFSSNFYLHPPFLWVDWNDALKSRAIKIAYETLKNDEPFNDINVFQSFSNLWTAILRYNYKRNIISLDIILYELLFFPLYDSAYIEQNISPKHKTNLDILLAIQSIQWMPARDYILNYDTLLPDNVPINGQLYNFQTIYMEWLKHQSMNLATIYHSNDGIKILLTLVFIANQFPQWFNAVRRMLNYFNHFPQEITKIITDQEELKKALISEVDCITRASSADSNPNARGLGAPECILTQVEGEKIEPVLVELLLREHGILHKLLSEPIPSHTLTMLQDREMNRACFFERGVQTMGTRCTPTVSIGRIMVSLHRANIRSDGVSIEQKKVIIEEISKWSGTWQELLYFPLVDQTFCSSNPCEPDIWRGRGYIPEGPSPANYQGPQPPPFTHYRQPDSTGSFSAQGASDDVTQVAPASGFATY